jgi:hypothetical protein
VMMALVASLATVLCREPDPVSRYSIDRADRNTIGADHLHVFLDVAVLHFARSLWLRNLPMVRPADAGKEAAGLI